MLTVNRYANFSYTYVLVSLVLIISVIAHSSSFNVNVFHRYFGLGITRIRSSHRRCSVKMVFLRISPKFTGENLCYVFFLLYLQVEFCEINKNIFFFTEHLWTTTSLELHFFQESTTYFCCCCCCCCFLFVDCLKIFFITMVTLCKEKKYSQIAILQTL